MYFLDSKLSYVSYIYPLVFSGSGGGVREYSKHEMYTLFVRNVLILEVLKCKRKKKERKNISPKTDYFKAKENVNYYIGGSPTP